MSYAQLRRGRVSEASRAYLVTAVTAGRVPRFESLLAARAVVRVMRGLHDEGWVESRAWVVMPDHLHWLFVLGEEASLAGVMQRLKGSSARAVNLLEGRTGALWQSAYHDHAVRAEEDLRAIARYVVANPLRAGLVTDIGLYPHWDAVWLDPLVG
ncbi:REP-associated tyrosine transposase [Viridibacterium curvum]